MEIEKLIEQKEQEYLERFGKQFFVDRSEALSNQDIIMQIDDCIAKGKPKSVKKYKNGVIY